jgi:hypothetical protein
MNKQKKTWNIRLTTTTTSQEENNINCKHNLIHLVIEVFSYLVAETKD